MTFQLVKDPHLALTVEELVILSGKIENYADYNALHYKIIKSIIYALTH